MKMTFRWYGPDDPVTLDKIRQIPGMSGVVSAVYEVPAGEVWPEEGIERIRAQAAQNGLEFEVVESVPVHEDIKLGAPGRDRLIANYAENIRRLGKAGVKVICYNFMPVFDWLRSELSHPLPDGSNALAYDNQTVQSMDPLKSELSLPGWDESYTHEGLRALLTQYKRRAALGQLCLLFEGHHPGVRAGGRQNGHPSGRSAVGHLWPAPDHHRG